MQTCYTPLEESPHGHTVPSVIIGIADNEARENEEEVYSQIYMIKYCRDRASCSIDIEMMIAQHYEGRYTAKSVKNLIARFGLQIGL